MSRKEDKNLLTELVHVPTRSALETQIKSVGEGGRKMGYPVILSKDGRDMMREELGMNENLHIPILKY